MDYTTWPDGFEAMKELLDFLPEDDAVRTAFLVGFLGVAVNL